MGSKNVTYRRPALLVWLLVVALAALPVLHNTRSSGGYCIRTDSEKTSDLSSIEVNGLPFPLLLTGEMSSDTRTCSGRSGQDPVSSENATITEVRFQDTAKRASFSTPDFSDHPILSRDTSPFYPGSIRSDIGTLTALRSVVLLI